MSYVSTVVVLCSYYTDRTHVEEACAPGWHTDRPFDRLRCLSHSDPDAEPTAKWNVVDAWGGSKCPESDVLGGAFNHLDLDELREHLRTVGFTAPVTLCHSTEGQERRWTVEVLAPGAGFVTVSADYSWLGT